MNYALATGNTYPHRRALRALGGVFDYAEKGYWMPQDKADEARKLSGVSVEIVELERDPFAPKSTDEIRQERQERIDRKRARLIDRAERAEKRAQAAQRRISPDERDFLRLGEPVKIGHHSQGRHQRLIERADKAFQDAGREYSYAEDLRKRADWMMDARVKGDKERAREATREKVLAQIAVGDRVSDPTFGTGVLLSISKKSARMKRDATGSSVLVPIHWLTLIEKGNPDSVKAARIVHRFKKGDAVLYYPHGKPNKYVAGLPAWKATVLRVNQYTYTIEHQYGTDKVREDHIEHAEGGA